MKPRRFAGRSNGYGLGMTEPSGAPDTDLDHDHLVETAESLRDVDPEEMPMDRGDEPGDRPAAAEKFGTTHAEEAQGEDLDHRLAQEQPDTPIMSDTGEGGERRDVLDAMAVNSADGQADDASGNDAAAAGPRDSGAQPEADREPHGPS